MSKKMTPCEKLGYKVGDRFEIIVSGYGWSPGDVVKLVRDDGTAAPEFEGVTAKNSRYDDNKMYLYIEGEKSCVKLIHAKLKPAKQALADAIHQNGGWQIDRHMFATSNALGDVFSYQNRPSRSGLLWVNGFLSKALFSTTKKLPNWHQCILSRDEYFTAYPEHKVEVEMKSESEMTIKVSDWHKNGELPPVGEVCQFFSDGYDDDWFDWCIFRGTATCGGFIIEHHHRTSPDRTTVTLFDPSSTKFRPLRTERDKAIDEMIDCLSGRLANCEELAEHLYENGYRKEVK